MTDENRRTLAAYQGHAQAYIDGTPHNVEGFVKVWIDKVLARLPKESVILELGSAFGRDADYIERAGYKVERTDAAGSFVDLLKRQGHEARLLNVLTDDPGGPYGLVFANAVLLHFTIDEFRMVLKKIYAGLAPGGIFAFSVKRGKGSEWSEAKLGAPRFFQYWEKTDLEQALSASGFSAAEITAEESKKWLHVIAKR